MEDRTPMKREVVKETLLVCLLSDVYVSIHFIIKILGLSMGFQNYSVKFLQRHAMQ